MSVLEIVVAVAIAVGLVGILLPLLPGTLLVGAGVLVWAFDTGGRTAWSVAALAVAVLLAGALLKYLLPGRRLSEAGVPQRTLWTGAALGVVGFFVIPVIGLVLGFVLGVHLAERARLGGRAAGPSTVAALRAVGLSIVIEVLAGMLAAATWVTGLLIT